jgi:hypothetical protein
MGKKETLLKMAGLPHHTNTDILLVVISGYHSLIVRTTLEVEGLS